MRITVKALGDHTGRIAEIPRGTRVVAEGPFGVFTAETRRRDKTLLIGGGIGITPIRALIEELDGDVVALYRVVHDEEVVFREELETLAEERGVRVVLVVGDHLSEDGGRLLSTAHLRELVPDVAEREIYLCGPPAMTAAVEKSLRRARVPRRHVHIERFAL